MQLTVEETIYTLQVTGGNQLQLRLDLTSQPIYSLRVSEVVQLHEETLSLVPSAKSSDDSTTRK